MVLKLAASFPSSAGFTVQRTVHGASLCSSPKAPLPEELETDAKKGEKPNLIPTLRKHHGVTQVEERRPQPCLKSFLCRCSWPQCLLLCLPRVCSHICYTHPRCSCSWEPGRWCHLDSRNPSPMHCLASRTLPRDPTITPVLSERENTRYSQSQIVLINLCINGDSHCLLVEICICHRIFF